MDGILICNKPIGMTSRDVVNRLNHIFRTKKMGHTGTLDPFASGVLIVTINKGTKISNYIEGMDKEYIAEIKFGVTTDTLDLDGQVIETKEVELPLDKERLKEIISHYIGEIEQVPPMYSAIKIDGEELYKKARRGEVVERKSRKVTIYSIDILSIAKDRMIIDVKCSKGTYIRTLASDIASDYGVGGHLTMLTRVKVGKYSIKDAKNIEELTDNDIIPIEDALSYLDKFNVYGFWETKAKNGVSLSLGDKELVVVIGSDNKAIAIYKLEEDGKHHCVRGLL